jgi:hypoxanthine-DNA glycosylase
MIKHDFKPIINKDSKILILGSFPSVKSRENDFYYMHPQNRFWPLMSAILEEDLVDASIQDKTKLLKKHHIALYDVIESCNINGSSDASISDVRPINLKELIKFSSIKHIYLNGRKAESLFNEYFPDYKSMAFYLPSTSPANARYRLDDLYKEWLTIIDHISDKE